MAHKTYLSKASAVRQAKKDHGVNYLDIVSIGENQDGKWQAVMLPKKEEVAVEEKLTPKVDSIQRRSSMSGACSLVWDIAGSMLAADPDTKRKDIIQACVDRGVAFYTARTQYQKYREALAASVIR